MTLLCSATCAHPILAVARFASRVKCCSYDAAPAPATSPAAAARPADSGPVDSGSSPACSARRRSTRRDGHPRRQSARTRARARDAGDRHAPLHARERATRAAGARGLCSRRTAGGVGARRHRADRATIELLARRQREGEACACRELLPVSHFFHFDVGERPDRDRHEWTARATLLASRRHAMLADVARAEAEPPRGIEQRGVASRRWIARLGDRGVVALVQRDDRGARARRLRDGRGHARDARRAVRAHAAARRHRFGGAHAARLAVARGQKPERRAAVRRARAWPRARGGRVSAARCAVSTAHDGDRRPKSRRVAAAGAALSRCDSGTSARCWRRRSSCSCIAFGASRRELLLARARSDFIAGVSHDLRMPLAQILIASETLSVAARAERRRARVARELDRSRDAAARRARRQRAAVLSIRRGGAQAGASPGAGRRAVRATSSTPCSSRSRTRARRSRSSPRRRRRDGRPTTRQAGARQPRRQRAQVRRARPAHSSRRRAAMAPRCGCTWTTRAPAFRRRSAIESSSRTRDWRTIRSSERTGTGLGLAVVRQIADACRRPRLARGRARSAGRAR